jgi:hypothetical protein
MCPMEKFDDKVIKIILETKIKFNKYFNKFEQDCKVEIYSYNAGKIPTFENIYDNLI